MPQAAVIGKPIAHSRSPLLHNAGYRALGLADWSYQAVECDAAGLPRLVSAAPESVRGFSVTMPGKLAALEFATEATARARAIGAANTLVRRPDGGWRADNTDCDGISGALDELGVSVTGKRVMVIGGGGTARPAVYAAALRGATELVLVNRADRAAELAPIARAGATEGGRGQAEAAGELLRWVPLSAPDSELSALAAGSEVVIATVPSDALAGRERTFAATAVLDVIYDPYPTPLATAAHSAGHRAVCGNVMLAHQATGQFEQFTGRKAPAAAMRAALDAELG